MNLKKRPQIDEPNDLLKDLANTHRMVDTSQSRQDQACEADYEQLMRDGYVVIEGLIDAEKINAIREQTHELLGKQGRNTFEGLKTQRLYDVLSKTDCIDELIEHPRILGLIDKIHQPNYLLSQAQMINILPGEAAQLLHHDDGFYQIPRPRPAMGCAAIWAIDDFTFDNGATRIIPGSHTFADGEFGSEDQAIACEMSAGSVVFFLGTTIHGGGANNSDAARLAVACQYCEPYLRQQENFLLEVSKERARSLSPQLQSMIGYSITPPFMGMVDGQHPIRLLSQDD